MTPDGASSRPPSTTRTAYGAARESSRESGVAATFGDRLPARAVLGVVTHRRSVSLFSLPLEYAALSLSLSLSRRFALALALARATEPLPLPSAFPLSFQWHTRKAVAAATAAPTHRVAQKLDTRTPRDQRGIRRSVALTTTTATCRIVDRREREFTAMRAIYLPSSLSVYHEHTFSLSIFIVAVGRCCCCCCTSAHTSLAEQLLLATRAAPVRRAAFMKRRASRESC